MKAFYTLRCAASGFCLSPLQLMGVSARLPTSYICSACWPVAMAASCILRSEVQILIHVLPDVSWYRYEISKEYLRYTYLRYCPAPWSQIPISRRLHSWAWSAWSKSANWEGAPKLEFVCSKNCYKFTYGILGHSHPWEMYQIFFSTVYSFFLF